jgi:hypothetical protein
VTGNKQQGQTVSFKLTEVSNRKKKRGNKKRKILNLGVK